jgi:hypothetical protein
MLTLFFGLSFEPENSAPVEEKQTYVTGIDENWFFFFGT